MAYDTLELEKQALKAIEENGLVFIDEVVTFLPCDRATFYNHGLDKFDSIKTALEAKKISLKAGLRKKWYASDNATVQIALYKLIGDETENGRLNSQNIKHSGEIKSNTVSIEVVNSGIKIHESELDIIADEG
jgi:hypothetical protein